METSECFIFGKIRECISVLGNIGKYNSTYIVDLIICPLGKFILIMFLVGRTLFRWANNAMKFPVHPESTTADFSRLICFLFFVVGAQ